MLFLLILIFIPTKTHKKLGWRNFFPLFFINLHFFVFMIFRPNNILEFSIPIFSFLSLRFSLSSSSCLIRSILFQQSFVSNWVPLVVCIQHFFTVGPCIIVLIVQVIVYAVDFFNLTQSAPQIIILRRNIGLDLFDLIVVKSLISTFKCSFLSLCHSF